MAPLRRSRLLIVGKDAHKRWEFRWGKWNYTLGGTARIALPHGKWVFR